MFNEKISLSAVSFEAGGDLGGFLVRQRVVREDRLRVARRAGVLLRAARRRRQRLG